MSQTVVGQALREHQKRIALEDCTNYLHQKTMNGHQHTGFSHNVNSNRSATS